MHTIALTLPVRNNSVFLYALTAVNVRFMRILYALTAVNVRFMRILYALTAVNVRFMRICTMHEALSQLSQKLAACPISKV